MASGMPSSARQIRATSASLPELSVKLGNHPARVQGEQDQQRSHPLPAHVHRPTCGIGDLKRAEHTHPNRVRRRDHVAFPDQSQTPRYRHHASAQPSRDLSRFLGLSPRHRRSTTLESATKEARNVVT
jgi:hypothetical protein